MKTKTVTFAGKTITVKEKSIGEFEQLMDKFFPGTKGKIKLKIDLDLFEKLHKIIPVIFPEITEDDVHKAYMSELEKLVQAFIEVNSSYFKKLDEVEINFLHFKIPIRKNELQAIIEEIEKQKSLEE